MADIKINAGQWNGLSADHKTKITEILRGTNLLHEGDQVIADSTVAAIEGLNAGTVHPESFWCSLACNAAEAAAVAACAALSGPAAAVCVVAAHAAGELCRSKC